MRGLEVAKLITPVPSADMVAPNRLIEEGAVAVRPPSTAMVPESVTVPELIKLVALVTARELKSRE